MACAGSSEGFDVHESALVAARPDGEATLLTSALRVRAHRVQTTRWTSLASAPAFYEVEPLRGRGDPHRALRWDVDENLWSREWSVGETVVIRSSGIWSDLGVRAEALREADGWRVENHGRYTLRSVAVLSGDGSARAVEDLPPAHIARIEVRAPSPTAKAAGPFWAGLLSGKAGAMSPVLLATLDPPISSLHLLDSPIRVSGETHLVLALPPAGGAAR
jgi:hypothetical protein